MCPSGSSLSPSLSASLVLNFIPDNRMRGSEVLFSFHSFPLLPRSLFSLFHTHTTRRGKERAAIEKGKRETCHSISFLQPSQGHSVACGSNHSKQRVGASSVSVILCSVFSLEKNVNGSYCIFSLSTNTIVSMQPDPCYRVFIFFFSSSHCFHWPLNT